jgi:hypothetical protein
MRIFSIGRRHGTSRLRGTANRLVVTATGTVADIEAAFHVQLKYGLRDDDSRFYAPDREPAIDLDIPVAHISDLDNFTVPRRGSTGRAWLG